MGLTHSHLCKHCDTTWSCHAEMECEYDGYDVSKQHEGCHDRKAYYRRLFFIMNGSAEEESPYLTRQQELQRWSKGRR